MTTDDDLDRRIQDYLQAGPVELSDRVLWTARAQISTTRRRGRLDRLAPWRDLQMSQSMRLLLAGGAGLAVVVAIGMGVIGQRPTGPGASVAPSSLSSVAPSASPSSTFATGTPEPSPSP